MVVSVKPFGCMPSSSVSDGVQSMISERSPEAIFCAIETTGDAAVNMQSRVQMQLFKAKAIAQIEFDRELAATGLTLAEAREKLARRKRHLATFYSIKEGVAGTGAKLLNGLAHRRAKHA